VICGCGDHNEANDPSRLGAFVDRPLVGAGRTGDYSGNFKEENPSVPKRLAGLQVVATPIGNLSDLSTAGPRQALEEADLIAAEDTTSYASECYRQWASRSPWCRFTPTTKSSVYRIFWSASLAGEGHRAW